MKQAIFLLTILLGGSVVYSTLLPNLLQSVGKISSNQINITSMAANQHNFEITPANAQVSRISHEEAQKLFNLRCAACHGKNGSGKRDIMPNSPDFTNDTWQKTKTDECLVKAIHDGLGNGKGAMPRWKNLLNPSEIQGLVNYIRALVSSTPPCSQPTNKRPPV